MLGKFFSSLAAKIFGGLSLVLLIVLWVMWGKLSNVKEDLKDEKQAHATTESERARFRDALAFFVNDGTIRIERGRAALKEHVGVSADLQRQADKIRTRTITVKGDCSTPKEVMGSTGL